MNELTKTEEASPSNAQPLGYVSFEEAAEFMDEVREHLNMQLEKAAKLDSVCTPINTACRESAEQRLLAIINEATLDLRSAHLSAVLTHRRWGIIDAFIKRGIVSSEEEYADLLKADIPHKFIVGRLSPLGDIVSKYIPNKPQQRLLLFIPGHLSAIELWEAAFRGNMHLLRNLDLLERARKIRPEDVPRLRHIRTYDPLMQRAQFVQAHEKSKHDAVQKSTKPSIAMYERPY